MSKKKKKKMKIAILSRNTRLYSTKRLVEAGIKRKHDMYVKIGRASCRERV